VSTIRSAQWGAVERIGVVGAGHANSQLPHDTCVYCKDCTDTLHPTQTWDGLSNLIPGGSARELPAMRAPRDESPLFNCATRKVSM
jgi:hypothetical protein